MADDAAKVDAILKSVRKEEGNKRCFVCQERGPQYVDVEHHVFVCTMCSGILREFSFRIKGLSMSTFTLAEAKALKGGNDEGKKALLTRFENAGPQPGEKEKIREFINDVFVKKRYAPRSSRKSSVEEEDETPPAKPKKPSEKTKSKPAEFDYDDEEEEAPPKRKANDKPRKESVEQVEEPRRPKSSSSKQQQAPKKDLLDMDFGDDSFVSAAPAAAAVNQPVKKVDPMDFFSAPAPAAPSANHTNMDFFSGASFQSAPFNSSAQQSRPMMPQPSPPTASIPNFLSTPAPASSSSFPSFSMPAQAHAPSPSAPSTNFMPTMAMPGQQQQPGQADMLAMLQNNPQMMAQMMAMMQAMNMAQQQPQMQQQQQQPQQQQQQQQPPSNSSKDPLASLF